MRTRPVTLQILFCLLVQFMLLAPPAALAREIRVDSECSLRDAITTFNTESATGGCRLPAWGKPHIILQSDITLTEPLPAIQTDLSIDGRGHQISGDKLHQIFVVYDHALTINNLHIVDGYSAENGGAIYVDRGDLNIVNSSIKYSVATDRGGAIYTDSTVVSISYSVIIGNSAKKGGGAYINYGRLTVQDSDFTKNVADYGGGSMSHFASTTVVDSRVEHNHARSSGGGIAIADSWLDIKRSAVTENSALKHGGGISLEGAFATLLNVNIADNFAGTDGGGIYWTRSTWHHGILTGTLEIDQSALSGNRAVQRGGGIFSDMRNIEVANSTFYDNKAGGNGGALYAEAGHGTLTHVTMMQNAALNGGGIYSRTPDLITLRNSIIAGSQGGDCVGGLKSHSGNWIQDGACSPSFRGDPQLNRFAGKPSYFPLLKISAAVNRADPAYCLDHDQLGRSRPQGEACDIGAYEAVDWVDTDYLEPPPAPVQSPDIIVDEDCSLADAIRSANRDQASGGCIAGAGPDTIRLTSDSKVNDILPHITSEIVIEGDNHTLTWVQFVVRYGNLTMNNLTLNGGAAGFWTDYNGGAFHIRYGKLQLNNVIQIGGLGARRRRHLQLRQRHNHHRQRITEQRSRRRFGRSALYRRRFRIHSQQQILGKLRRIVGRRHLRRRCDDSNHGQRL